MSFLFKGNRILIEKRQEILKSEFQDLQSFMKFALPHLKEGWYGDSYE